ncbi:hypothetical protein Tsubulata_037242 [Turnera subulata]|uniref:PAR1 protein n=1 Tax=Turnera subulata TaxID=218843 RepID=A0A9Q0GCD5_9ROSI|nr:hypothetical protein Tsubulata_037242 [Turnera subulata]
MALIIFLAFSLLLHGALGDLICEELPVELCSYSIATTGKRCLLETDMTKEGETKFQCKTSEVVVDVLKEWIETDDCVKACGLDRNTVGISTDSLLNPQFLAKLCSDACHQNCPNIVDLYTNLAMGEGAYLPTLCANPRRALSQTRSSGAAAGGPSYSTAADIAAPGPYYSYYNGDYSPAPASAPTTSAFAYAPSQI